MSDTVKQKRRWFLKTELAVLVCVICIWIVKLVTVDIDITKAAVISTKAAVLKQVVKIRPNSADAHSKLGNAYFHLDNYEGAIEAYKEATRINPDDADAYRHLADCYYSLGRNEAEIEAHKQVARLDPGDANAYSLLAGCYIEGDRYEEADETLRQLVRIDPNEAYIQLAILGFHYCESGHYEEAVEVSKQAIEIDPDITLAHYLLAKTYLKMGDKDLALEEYEILKTLDEESANELFEMLTDSYQFEECSENGK